MATMPSADASSSSLVPSPPQQQPPTPVYVAHVCPMQYVKKNKEEDKDWFRLESNEAGTKCVPLAASIRPLPSPTSPPPSHHRPLRWFGKCWTYVDKIKYEFDLEFDVSLGGRACGQGWLIFVSAPSILPHSIPAPTDPRSLSCDLARPGVARARRQDGQDVSRRQDLPDGPLQAAVGSQRAQVWHCPRPRPWRMLWSGGGCRVCKAGVWIGWLLLYLPNSTGCRGPTVVRRERSPPPTPSPASAGAVACGGDPRHGVQGYYQGQGRVWREDRGRSCGGKVERGSPHHLITLKHIYNGDKNNIYWKRMVVRYDWARVSPSCRLPSILA